MSSKRILLILCAVLAIIIQNASAMEPQENENKLSLESTDAAFKNAAFPPELCYAIVCHYSGSILDLSLVCKKFNILLKECCCVDNIYYSDEDLLSRPNLLAYKLNFNYPINFDLIMGMKNLTYLKYHGFECSKNNIELSSLNLTNIFYENFRNLRNLSLVHVIGVSIEVLEKMPHLEILEISNILSDYSEIPEDQDLYNLVDHKNSLQALKLTPLSNDSLGRLTRLKGLYIDNRENCGDTTVDPCVVQFTGSSVQHLSNLEKLVMVGCQIKDTDLTNLTKLKHFGYLTGYQLLRGFDPVLQRMNYESVSVQLTLAGLSQLTSLESLDIGLGGEMSDSEIEAYTYNIVIPTLSTLWQYNLKKLGEFSLPEKNFINRYLMLSHRYIHWYPEFCDFATKSLWIHLKEGNWPKWSFSNYLPEGFDPEALKLAGKEERQQIVFKLESEDKDPVLEVCEFRRIAFMVGVLFVSVFYRVIEFFVYLFI